MSASRARVSAEVCFAVGVRNALALEGLGSRFGFAGAFGSFRRGRLMLFDAVSTKVRLAES